MNRFPIIVVVSGFCLLVLAGVSGCPDEPDEVSSPLVEAPVDGQQFAHWSLVREFHEDGLHASREILEENYGKSCDAGYEPACKWKEWRGDHGPNLIQAGNLFSPYCAAGDSLACVVVGWSLSRVALGVVSENGKDLQRAMMLFRQACEEKYARGCLEVGALYIYGAGVPQDPVEGHRWVERACKLGSDNGCAIEGTRLFFGMGVPRNRTRGRKKMQASCEQGQTGSCGRLAEAYRQGWGVAKDLSRARALEMQGCKGGHPWFCRVVLLDKNRSVSERRHGREALSALCSTGSMTGCVMVREVASDPACRVPGDVLCPTAEEATVANQLLEQACVRGARLACAPE